MRNETTIQRKYVEQGEKISSIFRGFHVDVEFERKAASSSSVRVDPDRIR